MFQSFDASSDPAQGPSRLESLRAAMETAGVDGFLVPRADAHQGENVAPCDERLSWLTGFTGSAGFAAVLPDIAGVFIDGRYRLQVKSQVDLEHFTPVAWPETTLGSWLLDHTAKGCVIAFDPWLHSVAEIAALETKLGDDVTLVARENLIDQIWNDQPAPPLGKISKHPLNLSGKSSEEKRKETAQTLRDAGHSAAILTLPDSIAWLLNIRGTDIARTPVPRAFAIVHDTGHVDLITEGAKLENVDLDAGVTHHEPAEFDALLTTLTGKVRLDPASAPIAIKSAITSADVVHGDDPCVLPKACKNAVEIQGTRDAHARDAVAMIEFLAWLDATPKDNLTEIDVVTQLEGFRAKTNALHDISFETICGTGPNGAIVHYRVTRDTNRKIEDGDLLLVDSGAQYVDGTTDITRTIAIGAPTDDQRRCFTRVLKGMIAISRARFPVGVTGRDLDALARYPLWTAGQDYDHGTGHGVGSFLGVHEGPQSIARSPRGEVALKQGMILSNEPGYYREGEFGIRIENLIAVEPAPALNGADDRNMLSFETLTHVPIDQRLIVADELDTAERAWLNDYHASCYELSADRVDETTKLWLKAATQPI